MDAKWDPGFLLFTDAEAKRIYKQAEGPRGPRTSAVDADPRALAHGLNGISVLVSGDVILCQDSRIVRLRNSSSSALVKADLVRDYRGLPLTDPRSPIFAPNGDMLFVATPPREGAEAPAESDIMLVSSEALGGGYELVDGEPELPELPPPAQPVVVARVAGQV